MSATLATSAETGAAVIPLQRAEADLPRRTDHAAPWPHPNDHAYWDAEVEAFFSGSHARRSAEHHGRRCACCRPALEVDDDVAS